MKTKQKVRKQSPNDIDTIAISFALAMRNADTSYIARTGNMTERMKQIWEIYRLWCIEQSIPCRMPGKAPN